MTEPTEDQLMGAVRQYLYEHSRPPPKWNMGRDRNIIRQLAKQHTHEEIWRWIRGIGLMRQMGELNQPCTMRIFSTEWDGKPMYLTAEARYHKWIETFVTKEKRTKKRQPVASHLGNYLKHLANSSPTAEKNGSEETR